jgi:nucleoside 2-deoxyribosyltransferase
MPPLIYIAGPFRGKTRLDVVRNCEAVRDLGYEVARLGGYPVIPHMMTADFDGLLTDDFWLDGTMALMKACDAVVLHVRWEQSSGAVAERAMALELGMRVFDTNDPSWRTKYNLWRDKVQETRARKA